MAGSETLRRHRRDDVAEVALRILDDHGLADLTMRRLAAQLDVQPSALYWHFENKQTLIAELADRIVDRRLAPGVTRPDADADADADADWRERTRDEAAALRDALLAYRDGAEVVSSTYALGLGSGRALDRLTDAVSLGGFDEATSRRAGTALLHFILGHVSHEQQRLQYDSVGVLAGGLAGGPLGADDQAQAFAFGVGLLVDGLSLVPVSPR
ncbi:TetR/AcrR family transcriptional regulator C-terminal domain-containing protein [Plantibacter flavus]|uniref:TetR/AcrR family transcriptional regulator C-terminal domain-containing protein n=1 Tax=Plantibacter flavus TaxID=150123 RepID=UPI003F17CD96